MAIATRAQRAVFKEEVAKQLPQLLGRSVFTRGDIKRAYKLDIGGGQER